MDIMSYISEYALILIPFLYVLGMILKGTEIIKDKFIPVILLPVGVISSICLSGLSMSAIIQGVLVTGATIGVNQVYKQLKKEE